MGAGGLPRTIVRTKLDGTGLQTVITPPGWNAYVRNLVVTGTQLY